MRLMRTAAILLIFLGLALIVLGLITGELQVALFIFFPIIYGQGILGAAGVFLIFLGFIALFLSFSVSEPHNQRRAEIEEPTNEHPPSHENSKREFGGVIFIGPIPIVFGSGRELLRNKWFLVSIVVIALLLLSITLIFLLI